MANQVKQKISTKQIVMLLFVTAFAYAIFLKLVPVKYWPQCPIHFTTGLWCPGCGSQRAIASYLNLDFVTAIKHNVLLAISPVILGAHQIAKVKHNKRAQYVIAYIAAGLTLAFTIARNLPGSPLAP